MKQVICHIVGVLAIVGVGTATADVTFYEGENFAGRDYVVNQTVPNFDRTRFNDRAYSAIVITGQWEVCVDADFQGACQVLGPGRYPSLGGLAGRISSARPVANTVVSHRGGGNYKPVLDGYHGARATLYEGKNLSGRSFSLDSGVVANLDRTGFNDRASSLRVEAGYWMFCSDANFEGQCRTFGPGDYASLPRGLNDTISSGRRISDDYPYTQNPTWQR